LAGRANQTLAAAAGQVVLMVSDIPWSVKGKLANGGREPTGFPPALAASTEPVG
jgi:hypothetical protein